MIDKETDGARQDAEGRIFKQSDWGLNEGTFIYLTYVYQVNINRKYLYHYQHKSAMARLKKGYRAVSLDYLI